MYVRYGFAESIPHRSHSVDLTELQTAQRQAILFLTDGEADFTESDFASKLGSNTCVTAGGCKLNATHANVLLNVALAHPARLAVSG